MTRPLTVIKFLCIIFFLAGCTATESNRSGNTILDNFNGVPVLPQDANRIFIAPIENITGFHEAEEILRNRLLRLISREGRLAVTQNPKNAELLLEVQIRTYEVQRLSYDKHGRLDRQRLRITVSAAMSDCKRKKLIFRENDIQSFKEFSEISFPIKTENQTAEDVFLQLSERIYSKIKSGWYTEHLTDLEKRK